MNCRAVLKKMCYTNTPSEEMEVEEARNGRIGQIEQGILHVPGRHSAVVLPTSAQQQRWFVHADSVRWVRNEPIRRRCESGEGGCFAAQLRVHVLERRVREVRIAKDVHQ